MTNLPTGQQGWLRSWLGFEPNERAISLAPYALCAAVLGGVWFLVIDRLSATREALPPPGWGDQEVSSCIAFAVTTCLVATIFRRPILRTRLALLPLLAVALMMIGAALLTWLVVGAEVFTGQSPVFRELSGFTGLINVGCFGAILALLLGAVSIPGAIAVVFLLRWSGRVLRIRTHPPTAALTAASSVRA